MRNAHSAEGIELRKNRGLEHVLLEHVLHVSY